jgi:hypothetical protein
MKGTGIFIEYTKTLKITKDTGIKNYVEKQME